MNVCTGTVHPVCTHECRHEVTFTDVINFFIIYFYLFYIKFVNVPCTGYLCGMVQVRVLIHVTCMRKLFYIIYYER